MKPIQWACPHCQETGAGDQSLYGQQVQCRKCGATILIPAMPVGVEARTAALIPAPATATLAVRDEAVPEADIFTLSPVVRAFAGQVLLGVLLIGLAVGLAIRAPGWSWSPWVALGPLAPGVFLLLQVWIRVGSCRYRLSTQRLFVRRGWLRRHLNELELYRVKDVVVDQGSLQRLLGYGTVTVLADDETTPKLQLSRIAAPTEVKEQIRTQYRAARRREGVHPTELMQSPSPTSVEAGVLR